ncbi:MAG: tetratricopeptide repeat protein [Acidobacteriaceae bacterium]
MAHFIHRFAGIAIVQALLLSAICIAQAGVSETHIQRARQLIAEGKPEAAMAEYSAVLVGDPSNIEAQGNLGALQFFADGCSKATPHLSAALALDPSLARIQALVGICQGRQGRLEEANRNLTAALPLVTNPKIHILILTNLVEIEYARGDLQQAGANVAELTKSDPSNPDALYFAYRIYSDLADSARNALTVLAPDSARMHLLTAERFINAGAATMAIQQYQEALAKDPSLSGVHYELGEALLMESVSPGSLDRATAELQLALKEDPRNADAEAKLGIIDGIRGHSNLAEKHYLRALSLKGNEFDALVGLGDILRLQGKNEKAAEYLSQASKIDPMDDSLYFRLAQIYRDLGRKADAEREMKRYVIIRGLKSKTSLADQQREAH